MQALDLDTFYISTTEDRAALLARIAAGDFTLAAELIDLDPKQQKYKLAVVDNGYLQLGTFRGETVGETGMIVAAALYGDADLDGAVTIADYTEYAANLGGDRLDHWERGAFNGTCDPATNYPAESPNYLIWARAFSAT